MAAYGRSIASKLESLIFFSLAHRALAFMQHGMLCLYSLVREGRNGKATSVAVLAQAVESSLQVLVCLVLRHGHGFFSY